MQKFASTPKTQPKDSFSLINDPRNKYETLYTVERLGNIWGGRPVQCTSCYPPMHALTFPTDVNAPAQALEEAVITCIKADHPVFFGCDVGKALVSAQGVMDRDVYDTQLAFGYKLGMNKAQRLQMGESSVSCCT
jgi:bleomycin hydrolase